MSVPRHPWPLCRRGDLHLAEANPAPDTQGHDFASREDECVGTQIVAHGAQGLLERFSPIPP